MGPERHERVESLCIEALSKDASDRAAYLDAACGGDEALRREVESLLAERSEARAFLNTPAWSSGAARLTPGTRLGPYEIQSFIGAGGMGDVYKALDTRLHRTVAIKMLPPAIASDPGRRARFEREATTIAALSHPHICTLYDVGHLPSTGPGPAALYLVIEHLAGETLAARLQKGPLPLDQALGVAADIADALAAAHRGGVIHRDLKPGNVMLTKTGAKLLDFGLAKLRAPGAFLGTLPSSGTGENPVTADGMILGTVPYMAPEQLEGKEADARSDLFALGAVLYEMLAGKRAFEGESQAGIAAAILQDEPPPLALLQPRTPPAVERLVRQCLAKSPDDRPDTAHDVGNELRWMREISGLTVPRAARSRHQLFTRPAVLLACIVVAAAIGAGGMWLLRPVAPAASPVRLSLEVSPAENLNAGGALPGILYSPGGSRTALAWTPDGQTLVFVGRRGGVSPAYVQQVYVRRLDASEARPLKGTEGAQVPAVSSDSKWVAFWANGAIRKVPLGEGPVTDLMAGVAIPPWGLVWDDRGSLFFGNGSDGRIWQIPVEGAPRAITKPRDTESHILPWPLPGGGALLYTVRKRDMSWGDEEVVVETLATGNRSSLLTNAADARYLPTGHLVFMRLGKLWAVPFDPNRGRILGKEELVLGDVAQALTALNPWDVTGAGQFAVSATGMFASVQSAVVPCPTKTLVTVDRRGKATPLPAPPRCYNASVRVSPRDGRRVALTIQELTETGLWLYDLDRPGALTPLARNGEALFPQWSPDGRHLVFRWREGGRRSLAVQSADGTGSPRILVEGDFVPAFFTRDGRQVVALRFRGLNRAEGLVIVNVEDPQPVARTLAESRDVEEWPDLSPDGRWLAYASKFSGRAEVQVRPYPGPGRSDPVSIEGGDEPAWSSNGRELFFLSLGHGAGARTMMAVDFRPGSAPGPPRPLFAFNQRELHLAGTVLRIYDIASDGLRFYAIRGETPPPPPVVTHVDIVQNWFEELRARVPARR